MVRRGVGAKDRVVFVGGNANNGVTTGTFTLNANNDASNRNRNIGRQLAGSGLRQSPVCTGRRRADEYLPSHALGSGGEQREGSQQ